MKITARSIVYWNDGGKEVKGRVKQLFSDVALIDRDGTDYLVRKTALSTRPTRKN